VALLAAVCVAPGLAGSAIPQEEYRLHRAELRKAVTDGVVVLFGRTEGKGDDALTGFRQEPNFFYLTGWEEPGAILVMAPPATEILFLPPHNLKGERYTGRKTSAEDADARAVTGFEHVLPVSGFEAQLSKLLESYPKVYTLPGEAQASRLKPRELFDLQPALTRLRMKKSPREIELIQRAANITMEAHRAAWKRVAAGLFEYQIAATMTAVILERGCERTAYSPAVASGANGTVLHYWKNSRRMEKGDLLLMDMGAECSAYAADITRTVPVSGKFTARQREIYDLVLGAQKAIIAAIKPGVTQGAENTAPNSLYRIAYEYLNSHGKDREGNPLGRYLTHGVSHHVGLRVHDPGSAKEPLAAGMVVTAEPGLYIPEEGISIRIEDMILVTENGARVLTAALPKEAGEIEKAMAK
jgi:Xaa-Pro aminopeptidase